MAKDNVTSSFVPFNDENIAQKDTYNKVPRKLSHASVQYAFLTYMMNVDNKQSLATPSPRWYTLQNQIRAKNNYT